ncbi:MAG: Phosphoheptose isomerase [Betaproteobacteria bacterium ADurb.Bin341]|nr:MAG: Phosphoheptose isomerase [Betaproteobacteria bacterium ADurb.Bin341]
MMRLMNQKTNSHFSDYAQRLNNVLASTDWSGVALLAQSVQDAWASGRQVFLCGNGGSAGNAIHLANDYIYGVAKTTGGGIKAVALSANSAVITCLANDVGYDSIYSEQLAVLGDEGDVLIALSGSGNSPNIVKALEMARARKITTYAILGFDGGRCKGLADVAIHFPVNDMQIAEDLQLIVGHMVMQSLYNQRPQV